MRMDKKKKTNFIQASITHLATYSELFMSTKKPFVRSQKHHLMKSKWPFLSHFDRDLDVDKFPPIVFWQPVHKSLSSSPMASTAVPV
jgi:hypothetical protein